MKTVVKILGARGSIPVSGKEFVHYGGATSCIFVRIDGQMIVLDAGNGLLRLADEVEKGERKIPVLLSHPHADHMLGLPMCSLMFDAACHFSIYAVSHGGLDAQAQVSTLMGPPLWPVGPDKLPASVTFHEISEPFYLGNVRIEYMEGVHPGGVTLFRLSGGGKTVVYITDCTLVGDMMQRAAEFASGCDLLLCDGQYSVQEWPMCSGFGHSTWEMVAELGRLCGAGQTRVIHHDPRHTDAELDAASAELEKLCQNCTFAYEGEEIYL